MPEVTSLETMVSEAAPGLDPGTLSAVVLAAGRGERLRPHTDRRPKALLEVRGELLLDYHLRSLHEAGVRHAVVVVGYLANQVRDHLTKVRWPDLEVECVEQVPPRGTGDAVARAFDRVVSDPFLVVYADVYFGPELRQVYRELLSDGSAKIVAARVENGGAYGRLELSPREGGFQLSGIREKDGKATPAFVNAGLYLLPRQVGLALQSIPVSPRGEIEFTDAVEDLARRQPVRALITPTWYDVGTPARWTAANRGER
jgi:UDP-N-acetylglucosamine diphosphorylase / glucose-1-phosphate thymidylyltransferase / UDP-N-acetylgalactosamine diphosphorylase / glucosamine-1-phosphate N-acetyltransferase / galactosamine-1-phosphate N-acetyltransferase